MRVPVVPHPVPIDAKVVHVASVLLTFNVSLQVRVTALSNSRLQAVVDTLHANPYLSFSIQLFEVIATSPVALSILISSPHCEAREVVVVVQAVQ